MLVQIVMQGCGACLGRSDDEKRWDHPIYWSVRSGRLEQASRREHTGYSSVSWSFLGCGALIMRAASALLPVPILLQFPRE